MPPHAAEGSPSRPFILLRDGDPAPAGLRGGFAALGNFDGVHRGHRHLIDMAREEGGRHGRPALVLTFEPHPRTFFRPDQPIFRITPEAAKVRVMRRLGLDGVIVRRFDAALAATSAASFVERLLAAELGLGGIVVGPDFHFGKGREGNPALLRELCARHGIACLVAPSVAEGEEAISSSAIRRALEEGEIARANRLLGFRWFVEGVVRHGDKRGRTLGYPTANVALPPDCRLRHGIYAVRIATGDGAVRAGVASFGRRPTFDDGAPLLETFVFDFSGDLYGREVAVEFVAWIRGEERFADAEALVRRMDQDSAEARRFLAQAGQDGAASMIG